MYIYNDQRYFPLRTGGGSSTQRLGDIFAGRVTSKEEIRQEAREAFYAFGKRTVDITGALIGLILLFPLYAVTALLVWMDSRGPVVHRRRVLARQTLGDGFSVETFDAFKFRTMRPDADSYLRSCPELYAEYLKEHKLKEDPRVTRLGRFLRRTSIDELPQLVNILRGQMSLVGPRMITPEELERYGIHQSRLLSVKPGLTGLWQVSGRTNVGYDERVRLDMLYIEHRSLTLDIQILMRTVYCVLKGCGAH